MQRLKLGKLGSISIMSAIAMLVAMGFIMFVTLTAVAKVIGAALKHIM